MPQRCLGRRYRRFNKPKPTDAGSQSLDKQVEALVWAQLYERSSQETLAF